MPTCASSAHRRCEEDDGVEPGTIDVADVLRIASTGNSVLDDSDQNLAGESAPPEPTTPASFPGSSTRWSFGSNITIPDLLLKENDVKPAKSRPSTWPTWRRLRRRRMWMRGARLTAADWRGGPPSRGELARSSFWRRYGYSRVGLPGKRSSEIFTARRADPGRGSVRPRAAAARCCSRSCTFSSDPGSGRCGRPVLIIFGISSRRIGWRLGPASPRAELAGVSGVRSGGAMAGALNDEFDGGESGDFEPR